MKVGRLRHRVMLQARQDTESACGEVVPDWSTMLDAWASIEPLSGREYVAAQQVAADVTTRIVIRHRPGVNAAGRVLHQINPGQPEPAQYDVYDIVSALEDPVINRRWITLLCVRRMAAGWRSGEREQP